MTLDVVALVILSSISVFLLILLFIQRKSKLDVLEKYVEAETQKAIMMDKLEEALKENELKSIENSDGFLKFVSDSREWAFKYIEDVQDAFAKFNDRITPELEYADKYGILDMDSPSKESLSRINRAYKDLKKILPQDMVN
jgi:hypothetical protein